MNKTIEQLLKERQMRLPKPITLPDGDTLTPNEAVQIFSSFVRQMREANIEIPEVWDVRDQQLADTRHKLIMAQQAALDAQKQLAAERCGIMVRSAGISDEDARELMEQLLGRQSDSGLNQAFAEE
ncbi:MAG: hypothetical protein AAFV53_27160 [Myxococcota bacterium]